MAHVEPGPSDLTVTVARGGNKFILNGTLGNTEITISRMVLSLADAIYLHRKLGEALAAAGVDPHP